jgi:NDP-sugar pyrophosphorylase family protein
VTAISHALVLTAGLGTRLRPLTEVRAKPAIPLAGIPMIRRIVAALVDAGARDITCNLHYRPETIAAVLGDGADLDAHVRYSWELPEILGSAGGPRRALDIIGAPTFFIVNGDTLTDARLAELAAAHAASEALVTMALVPNREPNKYGGVLLDARGHVVGFARRGAGAESFHFIGVQVANREAFAGIGPNTVAASIGGVYDQLIVARPGSIRGFVVEARFWDIGSVADYWRTSHALAGPEGLPHGSRTRIDAEATIVDSILWDDVSVGAGAEIEHCIVTDGVAVAPGDRFRRSILIVDRGRIIATPLPGEHE